MNEMLALMSLKWLTGVTASFILPAISPNVKHIVFGSSIKCVDAFRIAIEEKTKLLIKQKHG